MAAKKASKRHIKTQFDRCASIRVAESESSSTSYHISAKGRIKTIHRSPTPELQVSIIPLAPPVDDEKLFEAQNDDIEEDPYLDCQMDAEVRTQVCYFLTHLTRTHNQPLSRHDRL
jgi:translation elongation factor EF-G